MMDAYALTNDYLGAKFERDAENFGGGATDDGYRVIGKYFREYLEIFTKKVEEDRPKRGNKGVRKYLYALPVDVLTLLALESAMSALAEPYDEEKEDVDDKTFRLRKMGARIEDECYGQTFRKLKADEADKIAKIISESSGSRSRRMRMLKRIAQEHEMEWEVWSDGDRQRAALWCGALLAEGPLFWMTEEGELCATELAVEETQLARASAILRNPRSFPQTGPVQLWDHHEIHLNGIKYPLVRTYQGALRNEVSRRFRRGEYAEVVKAINHAQAVMWRINKPILDLIKWAYESNLSTENKGYKIPPRKNTKVEKKTAEELDAMPDAQKRDYFRKRKRLKLVNKANNGNRSNLKQLLAKAEELVDRPFWTPINLDTRGRVYVLPSLSFQGNDHMRALFLFDEGQMLTPEGLDWLKVHVANCYGIDKVSFADRIAWVDSNYQMVMGVARDPKTNREWLEADSPFMFAAACMAVLDAHEGRPVHVPVSFDGSCSGLQHLCAMMRSTEGALVNLTPSDEPQDVYGVVAEEVNKVLEDETREERKDRAQILRAMDDGKGITRKIVKRLVMTFAYSSNLRGMTDQLMEDTIEPALYDFELGKTESCPYGETWKDCLQTAIYLAKITRASIERIIHDAARAMEFLKTTLKLWPHAGKTAVWHTPVGLPALMRYPKMETKRLQLFLGNKALRFDPRTAVETPVLNKVKTGNAASPNFVHSMDACHLMMVLLACKAEGINSVALVHDSFGCLPNDAPRFRKLIRQEMRRLYENDVLDDLRKETMEALELPPEKVPPVPAKGSLDLALIEQSEYCFA